MSRQTYNGNIKISDKHYLYGLRLLIQQADMSVLFVLIKQAAVQNMGTQIRHTSIVISMQRFLMQQADRCVLIEISYKTN